MSDTTQHPVIYTIGYLNDWSVADLLSVAEKLDAIVVDTRYKPTSRNPAWRHAHLLKHLGERYVRAPGFGNRNYKGGDIDLVDPAGAVDQLRPIPTAGQSVMLLCACKDPEKCHRRIAAGILAEALGLDIVDLGKGTDEAHPNLFESD